METLSLYYTDKYISRIASPTAHYRFCPRLSPKSPVLQIADALISTLALYQIYRRLKNQFYFKKAIIAVDRYLQVEEEICARQKNKTSFMGFMFNRHHQQRLFDVFFFSSHSVLRRILQLP